MSSAASYFAAVLSLIDLLLILLIARQVRQADPAASALPWLPPGTKIPGFSGVTVDGEQITPDWLHDGGHTLVGFFSSGCAPCHDQLPLFAQFVASGAAPSRTLAVVVGEDEDADEMAGTLAGAVKVIRERRRGPLTGAFANNAFPGVYLLDPDGVVVARGAAVAAVRAAAVARA